MLSECLWKKGGDFRLCIMKLLYWIRLSLEERLIP